MNPPVASRRAVVVYFFLMGCLFANWLARIPAVQKKLDLSESQLGIALLGTAVGVVIGLPLAGWLVGRYGSRTMTGITMMVFFSVFPLIALADSLPVLFGVMFLVGFSNGGMDISMNAQAVEIEKRYGRPIMSSFHAMYSLGGLVGALMGGAMAYLDVALLPHFLGAALGVMVLGVAAFPYTLPAEGQPGAGFGKPNRALLALGFVAFCASVSEGAMGDWSAVYLEKSLQTSAGFAAIGFAAYSLMMTVGRFSGDALTVRFGSVQIVRAGGIIGAVGLGAALLIGHPTAAIVGFACAGIGLSITIPVAFSAAGHVAGMQPGAALAAVATMGYSGFLAGPPLIGFVAEASSLTVGLFVTVFLMVMIALLARSVR